MPTGPSLIAHLGLPGVLVHDLLQLRAGHAGHDPLGVEQQVRASGRARPGPRTRARASTSSFRGARLATGTISAPIAIATSSGVFQAIGRPIGAWMRASSSSSRPPRAAPRVAARWCCGCPSRRCSPPGSSSAASSAGTSNFWSWVSTQMAVRSSTGARAMNSCGHSRHQLVGVREARGRDEDPPRVADGDAVAHEPAERRERRREVDRAEDVHRRPGDDGGDEPLRPADRHQPAVDPARAAAAPRRRPRRPARPPRPPRAGCPGSSPPIAVT